MSADLAFWTGLVRRRLWLVGLIVTLFTGASVAAALLIPPVYRAQARLVMESAQIPGDLATSTVSTAAAEQLQIIEQRMMSRANLIDMANRLGLYEGQDLDAAAIVDDMRSRTGLRISTSRDQATLMEMIFEAPTAELAAEGANAFVSFILEENVALRTARAGQTADFFRLEVQRLTEELDARSARILEFRLENRDALPEGLEGLRERQSEIATQLQAAESEVDRLTRARDAYVARHEATGRVDVLVEDSFTPFLRRLSALQQELDVVTAAGDGDGQRARDLRARIASVDRAIAAQLRAEGSGATSIFERQLAASDAEIAVREAEAERLRVQAAELGDAISRTLSNTITLEALERDHATTREQYAQAINRAATAETGDLIETLSRGQRISVIEQAIAPTSPDRPQRRLIVMGGFGGGLALALALVFLLEKLNSTLRRPADLTLALGIAPLAVIPYLDGPAAARPRRRWVAPAVIVALLGLAGAGAAAVHHFVAPLDQLAQRVLAGLGFGGDRSGG